MFYLQFGISVALFSVCVTGIAFPGPLATPVVKRLDANGWTPKPTSEPRPLLELFRRQEDPSFCGYLEGDPGMHDQLNLNSPMLNQPQTMLLLVQQVVRACMTIESAGSDAALALPSLIATSIRPVWKVNPCRSAVSNQSVSTILLSLPGKSHSISALASMH
jgi:hypothetical protein